VGGEETITTKVEIGVDKVSIVETVRASTTRLGVATVGTGAKVVCAGGSPCDSCFRVFAARALLNQPVGTRTSVLRGGNKTDEDITRERGCVYVPSFHG
jgi:hypothetical protein